MAEPFRREPPPIQSGEFTFSELDAAEQELVEAIVNWNLPTRFASLLTDVHGRSVVYQNPTRFSGDPGEFSGLQIIGAAGSPLTYA